MTNTSKGASRQVGIRLAVVALLFIIGWRFAVIARQLHPAAIAAEVGSIALSKEELNGEELVPSHEGRSLVYFQETEMGLGTYFWNAGHDRTRLLFVQKERGYFGEWGLVQWSPGDVYLACAYKSDADPQNPTRKIVIYDGTSGEPVQQITALWDSKFVWLSPRSFAYSLYNQAWLVMEQNADDKWVQIHSVNRFGDGELKNLTAISSHSVAWQQNGDIWTFDFVSGASEKMWESTTNKLEDFSYSEEDGCLRARCSDSEGPFLIVFRPGRSPEKQGTVLSRTHRDSRAVYEDLHLDQDGYSFAIKAGVDSEPTLFEWKGMIEYYKLSGDYLYFTGNPAGELPGIWQFNVKSKEIRCLGSSSKRHFSYTNIVTPIRGTGTNGSGGKMSYHVWAPLHFVQTKKYPLIIGQTHYMWFSYEQIAANDDWFFAFADRPSWWDGLSHWKIDVKVLYAILAKNPNIDTNRIFLFATSAESGYLNQLTAEEPDLVKGAILFDPITEPDLSNTHLSKIFIASGTDDGDAVKRLTKYQNDAAKAGVPVWLLLQDGAQHVTRSIATERQRAREFAQFLVGN